MNEERLIEAVAMADMLIDEPHLLGTSNRGRISAMLRELVGEVRRLQLFEIKAHEANALLFKLHASPPSPPQ
jgi:hypothetical protein